MISSKVRNRLLVAVSGLAAVGATSASAAGCNGVVSQLEWGCAAWDNNNGPQYPHYKGSASSAPKTIHVPGLNVPAGTVLRIQGADLVDAKTGRLVASGGGNLVASGGGNLVASGGGNLVASGGGNLTIR